MADHNPVPGQLVEQPAPARHTAPLWRALLRRSVRALGALSAVGLSALLGPLVLLLLAWGLWTWSATAGSLEVALKLVHWALPTHQVLHSSQVQGNLQHGGRIGQLRWQSQGLDVQAQQVDIVLDWSSLWHQAWPLRSIHLNTLHIDDQRPTKAAQPLTELRWPLPLQLSVQVDHFSWQGRAELTMSELRAQYAYDGQTHRLVVDSLAMAQGRYTLQASLQGAAPMALKIAVQGQIQTPGTARAPSVPLALTSSVQGDLSGANALLSLQAQLVRALESDTRPDSHPNTSHLTKKPVSQDALLKLQAQVHPWQAQAITDAQGQWKDLDLAPLWPGAPKTLLDGQAHLLPKDQGWQLDAQLSNRLAGAWDQQRLPLAQLNLQARHDDGLWHVSQLQAQIAGGQVRGQGQQTRTGWTGRLDLQGIDPGQVHTDWLGPKLQGRLQAQSTEAGAIRYQADLTAPGQAQPPSNRPASLPWQRLQLAGQWHQQTWDIDTLRLQASQALLEAQFKLQPGQQTVQGRMTLQLPGLQAQVQGSLAPLNGQGSLSMDVQDAAASQAWLQVLPGLKSALQHVQASGPGQLKAQWQGGYAQPSTALSLQLQWPRIAWLAAPDTTAKVSPQSAAPWFAGPGQLELQGTPQSFHARGQGRFGQGHHSTEVQSALSASRPDVHSAHWQGRLERLDLSLPNAQQADAPAWRLQLQPMLAWQAWLDQGAVQWGPSKWQLQGPTPGTSVLEGEAGAWTAASSGRPAHSHGAVRWRQLPLAWARAWMGSDIQSDMVLQGQSQWRMDQDLSLSMTLERSQGDVYIQTENQPGQRSAAGLREARVQLRVHNRQLHTDLRWDSTHLGQAQASLQSPLSPSAEGWQWAANAPLSGSVQARLPQIGAWSVLAPPGWRVQGTLDASFELSGTRQRPEWQGRLNADQLAVRSAVQGIEFSQGQLQARLQGRTLVLERLSLRGAGAQGGQLLAQGQVQFDTTGAQVATTPEQAFQSALLALQIEAKGLRVSNRADRRVSISGKVSAQMAQGQLQLRGGLQADQALFILPEDSTPSLGEDVVVIRPGMGPTFEMAAAQGAIPQPPARSWLGLPDVRVTLDLGPDFRLQGRGIDTRLAGQVELVSHASTQGQVRLTGQVRTVGGRYKAYGQQLNIETGVLRFNGPYDNPSLDIIALRPNLPQTVGVQITGTALLPRIRLYAEPDLPDADKLAWLVLGRSAASGGAESAVLQQAAVALLSGNGKTLSGELANSLGLDEISLATGSRSDVTATGAAVTLGKRLSKDFYLAYETSLSGTFGSLYIFYDLSRRLTLRAQAGEQSALDLIYTVRHD